MDLYTNAEETHYSREKAGKNQPAMPMYFQHNVVNRQQHEDRCVFGMWYTGSVTAEPCNFRIWRIHLEYLSARESIVKAYSTAIMLLDLTLKIICRWMSNEIISQFLLPPKFPSLSYCCGWFLCCPRLLISLLILSQPLLEGHGNSDLLLPGIRSCTFPSLDLSIRAPHPSRAPLALHSWAQVLSGSREHSNSENGLGSTIANPIH